MDDGAAGNAAVEDVTGGARIDHDVAGACNGQRARVGHPACGGNEIGCCVATQNEVHVGDAASVVD